MVLGPNGAGKSTLVKAIAGLVPIHSGTVYLGDRRIDAVPVHEKILQGLAFVPQTENVFTTLSIHENLQLAAAVLRKELRAARIAELYAMFPDLAARRAFAPASSGGPAPDAGCGPGAHRLAFGTHPDEPSAGLSPKIVARCFRGCARSTAAGVTIVSVEQNVKAALAIADRAVILVEGQRGNAPPGPGRDARRTIRSSPSSISGRALDGECAVMAGLLDDDVPSPLWVGGKGWGCATPARGMPASVLDKCARISYVPHPHLTPPHKGEGVARVAL